ncbi:MAG: hypothetical protein O2894_02330 [Planctomycetota bacterium]|nr:hypothetical protein [Planctomycetota bacterium]
MVRPHLLSRLAAGLLCGALLVGCQSDDEVRISPVPAGYAALLRQQQHSQASRLALSEGGRTVDELLAVVDGEVLTRREVMRSLRIKKEDEGDDVEEEIRGVRLTWAKQRLVMAAARRAGLRIPPSAIDSIVDDQLKADMAENEDKTGAKLTQEEYLVERGITREEYRDQIYGAVVSHWYIRKLMEGIGGTRPENDKRVDPNEVRRIYADHRAKFDLPPGVRVAMFQLPIDAYEAEGRDFLEAEQFAEQAAERLAQEFRTGVEPAALAERYRVPRPAWQVTKDFIVRFPQPEANDWLFEPGRRAQDVRVFRDAGGPIVLGVVELRAGRRRTLADPEVYDLIVALLEGARERHLRARLTIELLDRGSVVWPDELADELLDDAQSDLDLIASHEMVGSARLK